MNILHVNNVDAYGKRFNGFDMMKALEKQEGISVRQVVMDRHSDEKSVLPLMQHPMDCVLRKHITACEAELSLHQMLFPDLWRLQDMEVFQQADVMHYHLLHNYFGALPILPELTAQKPSVLTLHDPYYFTGHCIYPLECEKWRTGCRECDNLDIIFSMKDPKNAARLWEIKRRVFHASNLDIVVASKFMLKMLQDSPIFSQQQKENAHLIPFGIDTDQFTPSQSKDAIREKLGIPKDNITLFFRSDTNEFKGFDVIRQMLRKWKPSRRVTLISVNYPHLMDEFKKKYHVIAFNWVNDSRELSELYCACDIFLMPSKAEAFGLMAIEAMSSGRPVIVCDNTSLPDVTFAPECGISIPQNDADALIRAVEKLIAHPEERQWRGMRGRQLAMLHYRFESYLNAHIRLYEQLMHIKEPTFKKTPYMPLVSIVIPVYNGANFMREAIDSALAQTYPNIEVVVVNDGSKDNGETERIALSYGDRISYYKKENGGVATALNYGIKHMKGEYFSWLSHDDMYAIEKVQSQVEALQEAEDKTTIVACGFRVMDVYGTEKFIVDPINLMYPKETLERPLFALMRSCIHGCALLIHKSHFERVGLFRDGMPTTQDYDLWFRMMRKHPLIFSEGLYVFSRSHEEQDSKKMVEIHIPECNTLWKRMIDTMDEEDMVLMDGSRIAFLENTWKMLRDITPYREAEVYVHNLYQKALKQEKSIN